MGVVCATSEKNALTKKEKLETWQLRMHCNLRQPDATQALSPLIRRSGKFEVAQPIHCRLRAYLLLIRYVTLWPWTLTPWPWPLTFDIKHLWSAGYAVMKLCTKFELNRAIRGGVIAVWTLTLWPWTYTTSCAMLWDSLNSVKLSVHEMWRFFYANTPYHAMILIFDPLTLKVCGRSGGTWS